MNNLYLQRMGITVWKMRKNTEPHFFYVVLKNENGNPVGLLLADMNLTHQEAETLFIEKIGAALTAHSQVDKVTAENIFLEGFKFIIALGKKSQALTHQLSLSQYIPTLSLTDLLENMPEKKELWIKIKPLRDWLC